MIWRSLWRFFIKDSNFSKNIRRRSWNLLGNWSERLRKLAAGV